MVSIFRRKRRQVEPRERVVPRIKHTDFLAIFDQGRQHGRVHDPVPGAVGANQPGTKPPTRSAPRGCGGPRSRRGFPAGTLVAVCGLATCADLTELALDAVWDAMPASWTRPPQSASWSRWSTTKHKPFLRGNGAPSGMTNEECLSQILAVILPPPPIIGWGPQIHLASCNRYLLSDCSAAARTRRSGSSHAFLSAVRDSSPGMAFRAMAAPPRTAGGASELVAASIRAFRAG